MSDPKESKTLKLSKLDLAALLCTAGGFLGLGLVELVQGFLGVTGGQVMDSPIGAAFVWSFSALFLVGLLVLFPMAYSARRRSEPKQEPNPMPWYGVFLIPLGLGDGSWTMPRWITWPLALMLFALAGLILVPLIGMLLNGL